MVSRPYRMIVFLCLALLFIASAPTTTPAKDLYSEKIYGAISLGLSIWSFKGAYDALQTASDAYDGYKLAGTAQRATELYDESKRNDTKAAILLGLGIGTLSYSAHLFLSGKSEDELPPPKMNDRLVELKGVSVRLAADPWAQGVKLNLSRGF